MEHIAQISGPAGMLVPVLQGPVVGEAEPTLSEPGGDRGVVRLRTEGAQDVRHVLLECLNGVSR